MNTALKLYERLARFPFALNAINSVRDFVTLHQYRRRGHFAQHGEDLFLADYFGDRVGTYVDIGGNHPFRISNTYLLYTKGWRGVVVEPIKSHCQLHRKFRPRDTQLACAVGGEARQATFYELVPSVLSTFDPEEAKRQIAQGSRLHAERQVEIITLKDVFTKHTKTDRWELLSVDTEGFDYQILSSNDWGTCRPQLVIFESNPGASSESDELLQRVGYKFLQQFGCNRLYEDSQK